jgi:hypothetical protein
MRRSLIMAFFMLVLSVLGLAQKNLPSADQRASRQTKNLQDQLHLTADQVTKVHMILLDRAVQVDSLRKTGGGDKKSNRRAAKNIIRDSDDQINAILTDEQKKLYAAWKQEQHNHARRQAVIDSLRAVN